jgi:hypothetical protein
MMLGDSFIDLLVMDAEGTHHDLRCLFPKTSAALYVREEEGDHTIRQLHVLKLPAVVTAKGWGHDRIDPRRRDLSV